VIADLRVLSGARAGTTITITSEIIAGRAPGLGLQFDPGQDLDVSAQHAAIVYTGGRWVVRDLGSRNGTFVNGRRVREADLEHGDRIRFGVDGPEAEFRPRSVSGSPSASRRSPRVLLEQSNRQLRVMVGALIVALVGALGYATWSATRQRTEWERERASLLGRVDSALAAGDETARTLSGEREGLATALRDAQAEVRRVRGQLETTSGEDTAGTADLRRQLQSAMAALDRQQLAASIDFDAISAATRHAVAVVWVELRDGTVSTGTGFAVRADGTLVTSRHVLTGGVAGGSPRRLAVQFADSRQVWPADVLGMDDNADIAVIRARNIIGGVPTVARLNLRADTLPPGSPIAWIGFPLGGETWPQDANTGRVARPLGAVGVLSTVEPARIAVQGYGGAAGASGSPILDEAGGVIAVLMGGTPSGRNLEIIGVPAAAVDGLLRRVAPAGGAAVSPR
jgi:pSer/pThr/pTyr-binding forkhead associated (FHA) protein